MTRREIQKTLENIFSNPQGYDDLEFYKNQNTSLNNLLESVVSRVGELETTVQQLKDEINRLKGEQGKPNIRAQKKDSDDQDPNDTNHSSEAERKATKRKRGKKKKRKKRDYINIDQTVDCKINKTELPEDAVSKGFTTSIIQDLEIKTNNIAFQREVFYSPSQNKTFTAPLPPGYSGGFGPGVRSLSLSLYHDGKMTQKNLKNFFNTFGIQLSKSSVSRLLIEGHEIFHQEKEDIIYAGFKSTPYQQIDDTSARVNGKNHYTHILCNPLYTAYFTMPKKDRLTVLSILHQGELQFAFNEQAFELMKQLGLKKNSLLKLQTMFPNEAILTRCEVDQLLEQLFPTANKKKHKKNKQVILDASAIAFYRGSKHAIDFLVCDDAPQFNLITAHKVLCWIHEGRHYKKLNPIVPKHKILLDDFISKFWEFYEKLLDYKSVPNQKLAIELSDEFDKLFSTKTGYDDLDDRNAKTQSKKAKLLICLQFPFLPLHNNASELGARVKARDRDIHLQNRNEKGTKAKDTFATITETARKLSVNAYQYFYDRITRAFNMPSLANLIEQHSSQIPPPVLDTS